MKKDEIVLDPTDINAVRTAYNNIMRALMEKLSAKVKATRGVNPTFHVRTRFQLSPKE